MKSNKFALKKNAQAMVEFALVLPILLLLLYGIFETGRLLFIYSTIVTASRQASRYGATTGMGGNYTSTGGPDNSGVSRYQDCYGIRAAAQKVDFLNAFNNDDIFIYYDKGPTNPPTDVGVDETQVCINPADATTPDYDPSNNYRMVVKIRGDFAPIVRLIPFAERTQANNKPIIAKSARTILVSISIPVNAGPVAEATTMNLDGSPDSPVAMGEEVTFTATVADGASTPTGAVTFSVDGAALTFCNPVALDPSGVAVCKITFGSEGTFVIQADYDPQGANFQTSSASMNYLVGDASTAVEITGPGWSFPNDDVVYTVTVTSSFGVPTGEVDVVSTGGGGSCTVTLDPTGKGPCTLNFPNLGSFTIDADYNGDSGHLASTAPTKDHDVLSVAATPTFTPKPTATKTLQPSPTPAFTPTFTATVLPNCQIIRDSVGSLVIRNDEDNEVSAMYLDIPNATGAPITIDSVRVGWNYEDGHSGKDHTLRLKVAALNGTVFWTGDEYLPVFQVPLPASPLVMPQTGPSQIVFAFHQTYDRLENESIYITFSTPGCTGYPINVTSVIEE